ncbi:hypothetical protein ES288_D01G068100v1 [Gossypium darwinii]|uniref:Uncharacterized protein n=1 Tax=Gossypium darwinii TaxID=34276 RepID=A0A5D2DME9_GOSDA|nr:hypothetical protein ES288_D01G068100v1 [Gossypium darwinii]TYG82199.1 hypothetical protein ES288_D01G068100v1 [Gossypium darwinii]
MGKSSSLKKKRSKRSSQLRMRKRNKVKGKKSKSKKLRHRQDDSVSYSDDTDSTSTASISSSSSEDDYKSRRSQSRNRKDMKGKKKRARRRSSGRESSGNSPCIKKRGGSRKRTSKRKKSTRDVIMSSRSSSSRSLSCSTCPSDSDESGYEKRKGRSERREKYGRSEKVKGGSKRSKGRSRSCSSCSRYNEGSDHSIGERVMEESNTRRLKSVITVVKRENESSRELIADEPKEDVYDYDDYPSCRSNDSNDGCNPRELQQYPHAISETKRPPDDEQVEVSNVRMSSIEEINVSNATDGLIGDDIELILRQHALENLKKFRGGLQKNINPPITPNDNSAADVKTLSSVNTDSFQIKAPKADDGRMVITSQVSQQIRQSPVRRDSSTLPKNDRNTPHMSDGRYSETVGSDLAPPLARVVSTSVPTNKPKLVISQTGLEAPNTHTTRKQEAATQEPCQAKLVTDSNVDEGGLETTQTIKPSEENAASVSNRPKSVKLRAGQEPPNTYSTQKQDSAALESSQGKSVTESSVNDSSSQSVNPHECGNPGSKVNDTCNKPTSSGNISSDKLEDETKDGSQFQQKTMSVMRGGEMVQVSYQVYIPKRAPALARRQLKR